MKFQEIVTTIPTLGEAKIPSPLLQTTDHGGASYFVEEDERILLHVNQKAVNELKKKGIAAPAFECAGPRRNIYFDPSKLRCALVTCGGLCPGLNDIIRSVVLELYHRYGVKHILGIRYGLQGFIPQYGHSTLDLTPERVVHILERGGSILGSSRGDQDIDEIVDSLERMHIGILFMIGGDGTLAAASCIADAITQRGLKISVIGIPKTIDNDVYLVARSFGFDTAVDVATQAISGAHNEAEGYPNGIGLIKLMGRESGFLAATAALARQDVNFVLIPEVSFDIEGANGLLENLEKRLALRGHAVIVVAEGAGQEFFSKEREHDASGNLKLNDIGLLLKERIIDHFKAKNIPISMKYIDPSYTIRSLPANANDHVFCSFLGRDAVHAGMTGKTKLVVSHWNNHFVHVPMDQVVKKRKKVDPCGKLWATVLEATGQSSLKNPH
ncbi:MAG: ATP-dependent 6-phosphofructokinase [Desulfobacterales bacterium]|nr:ATP-dependent 6-phosphofructokinase [Desulfobacterales bacterium]